MKSADGSRTTTVYDAANQIAYSVDVSGRTTYTFDANGNQQLVVEPNGDRTTNTWGFENKNNKVELPSGIMNTFTHDGDGLRVQIDNSEGTSKIIWDGMQYLAETDAASNITVLYTNVPDEYTDLISQRDAAKTTWFHYDALGSTREATDSAETVTDTFLHDAWGNEVAHTGNGRIIFTWIGRYGYHREIDTGAFYVVERILDPPSARWTSRDPLDIEARDLNSYWYVLNNPIAYIDPEGAVPCFVERCFKSIGYRTWRTFVVTSPHWRTLLDNWYFERGPNPSIFRGIADPRNADISSNIGFRKLLQCWLALRICRTAIPAGRWRVTRGGFQWQYAYDRRDAAGGSAAYGPATNFLGTYTANVRFIRKAPPTCDVHIEIDNASGWTSATRIPGRFRRFVGGRISLFPDHPRFAGRCLPSRGGLYFQTYIFDLRGLPCCPPAACICILP